MHTTACGGCSRGVPHKSNASPFLALFLFFVCRFANKLLLLMLDVHSIRHLQLSEGQLSYRSLLVISVHISPRAHIPSHADPGRRAHDEVIYFCRYTKGRHHLVDATRGSRPNPAAPQGFTPVLIFVPTLTLSTLRGTTHHKCWSLPSTRHLLIVHI